MSKLELNIEGPHLMRALAEVLPKLADAMEADVSAWDRRLLVAVEDRPVAPAEAEEPVEEKPKRGRPAKARKEPEPAIRATPEAREEPEPEVVTGEVVDGEEDDRVYTREDVKAALTQFANKFGMAEASSRGPKLMGAARLSAIEDSPEAFKSATLALLEAVANG